MKHVSFLLISLFFLQAPLSRDTTKNTIPKNHEYRIQQIEDPSELFLKYESLISEEAREYRKHIEEYTSAFIRLVSIIGSVVMIIITVFGIGTWIQIRRTVNKLFQKNVEKAMEKKFDEYDSIVKVRAKEYEALLLDLTRGIAWFQDEENYSIDPAKLVGKKILWVDDNPSRNELPENVLTAAGIDFTNVHATENVLKALGKAKKFDLIITNMGRGKDSRAGITLLKKLNEIENNIPVIVFSRPQTIKKYDEEIRQLNAKAVTGYTQIMIEVQRTLGK